MKVTGLLIGCWMIGVGAQAAPDPDSALWAATMIGCQQQQQALDNLSRWEAINLVLIGKQPDQIPAWQAIEPHLWENIWWNHADALPPGIRDSIQMELGMLDLLSQTVNRTDREAFALRHQDPHKALSSLHELAIAVEDANIVIDRLRHQLQAAARRIHRYPSASPEALARNYFAEGMDQAWQLMEGIKTGRRQDTERWVEEAGRWLSQARQRRKAWERSSEKRGGSVEEAIWRRWERVFELLLEDTDRWLNGGYPERAVHTDWSRTYLWYNHVLVPRSSGGTESLTQLLLQFWETSGTYCHPDVGRLPAFRPLGLPEASVAYRDPTSWIFVVDISGSMRESHRLPLFRQALAAWVARQPGDHSISLITFSDTAELLLQDVSAADYQDVLNQSGWINSGGDSDVLPAMEQAAFTARSSRGVPRIVLVSDGGFRYDQALAAVVEGLAYDRIAVDAVFMPGADPRYEAALKKLIGIGTGTMIRLERGAGTLPMSAR